MDTTEYSTDNIKLACVLSALGIAPRRYDPVTCIRSDRGGKEHDQYTFWFEVTGKDQVAPLVNAFYQFLKEGRYSLDEEHPLYYITGALMNRDVMLNFMRQAVPFKAIQDGKRFILMPVNASATLRQQIRKHL